jgi:hypothetical protein
METCPFEKMAYCPDHEWEHVDAHRKAKAETNRRYMESVHRTLAPSLDPGPFVDGFAEEDG